MTSNIAVSLDLDGTLITDCHLERTIALAQLEALATEYFSSYDRAAATIAVDRFFSSTRDTDRSIDVFIAWLYKHFARVGHVAASAANNFRAAVIAAAPSYVTAIPGARETLAGIERLKIPYAMLTNGWSPLQEEKARLIDFRGRVFVSERIGARKPSPESFAQIREHFAVPVDRIWHVGDNARADCGGAKNAGMTTVWFDWQGERYPADVPPPDYAVHSHAELLSLLSTNTRTRTL